MEDLLETAAVTLEEFPRAGEAGSFDSNGDGLMAAGPVGFDAVGDGLAAAAAEDLDSIPEKW